MLLVASAAALAGRPIAAADGAQPKALHFRVLHASDGTPVDGAAISLRMTGAQVRINHTLTTDAEGRAVFEYPPGDSPVYLWATVDHPGLVRYYVQFGRDLPPFALPTEKVIRMQPGRPVGGRVVDPQGKPVEGARVSITVPATDTPSEISYHLLYDLTPPTGEWKLDAAPKDGGRLHVSIEHPQFLKASFPVHDGPDGRYVLDPGLTLTGRVMDAAGKPVPAATITVGRDRWGRVDRPTAVGEDGSYTVSALSAGETWVTAEAPGFAPQVRGVVIAEQTPRVEFQLQPGRVTRFRVTDADGRPLAGVTIVADTWNGFRSLWWRATTDAAGEATWNGAPDEPVEFHILKTGYAALRNVVVAPHEEPHPVRLHRSLRIQGLVIDGDKNKVPEFRVFPGSKRPQRDEITWDQYEGTVGRDGRFELACREAVDAVYIRIEAPGYKPWESEAIRFDAAEQMIFARLERGRDLAGVVLLPDGAPAAGAALTLANSNDSVELTRNLQIKVRRGGQSAHADDAGKFRFVTLDQDGVVYAVHDGGFAAISVEKLLQSGEVRLQAWARLEVSARRGPDPLPKVRIDVQPARDDLAMQRLYFTVNDVTGEDGEVTFARVVPGRQSISLFSDPGGNGFMSGSPERIEVVALKPGEAARIVLGGSGATVIGRIEMDGRQPGPHAWELNQPLRLTSLDPAPSAQVQRILWCPLREDGSFEMADVPPGRYRLSLSLTPPRRNATSYIALGFVNQTVSVTDEAPVCDLGAIRGVWNPSLERGDPAPAFAAPGLFGESVRLVDYAGRLILLDFWDPSRPERGAMDRPQLAELHAEFAADPRFVLFGIVLNGRPETAAKSPLAVDYPGTALFGGSESVSHVPRRYHLRQVPERFLIDVDGTLLYRGADLVEIAVLIRRRLQEIDAGERPGQQFLRGVAPAKVDDDFQSEQTLSLLAAVHNANYDDGEDETTGPGLLTWTAEGASVREFKDLLMSGWLGGPQRVAIDPGRERLYVCDTRAQQLVALNRRGRRLFTAHVPQIHAVAVDEPTGDIWCLTLSNLTSGELIVLDAEGREKTSQARTAFALAYSPREDAFWIVGQSIDKVSREGEVLQSQPLPPGGYTFGEIAIDREQGGGWVLEQSNSDGPRNMPTLWRLTPDGAEPQPVHQLPRRTFVRSLACVAGEAWLAVGTLHQQDDERVVQWELLRCGTDGRPLEAPPIPAEELTVGLLSGEIWIQTEQEIRKVDREGTPLLTIPLGSKLQLVQLLAF